MTTDELNAIVQAVMLEMEKAGVDFDFKAETPQTDDLVYVMRGTSDKYKGITVKWQNLLDIIVKKATDAKDEAVSAKDIALQTLATIQGIESNVSSMKSSVDASEANVASMKASVEASEANVTQMKSDVSEMKTSVEGTKTEVEGLKSDVTALKAQTQTIVDNAKNDVTGLLDTKVDKSSVLTYDNITASTPPMDLDSAVASASALKHLKPITGHLGLGNVTYGTTLAYLEGANVTIPANCIFGINASIDWNTGKPLLIMLSEENSGVHPTNLASTSNNGDNTPICCSYTGYTYSETTIYVWGKSYTDSTLTNVAIRYWYIQL